MKRHLLLFLTALLLTLPSAIKAQDFVQVGSIGINAYQTPTHNNRNYSLTQQIYTAGEIGRSGTIYSIAIRSNFDEAVRNLDIYMVHTNKTSYSNGADWVPVTTANRVFSGDVNFIGDNQWSTIELSVPFNYNGTDNLLLVVDDNTGSAGGSKYFGCIDAWVFQSLCINGYDTDYDPANPGTYTGSRSSYKPVLRLNFSPILCHAPSIPSFSNISQTSATMSWSQGGGAAEWQICMNNDEANAVTVTTNSYSFSGLTPYTKYTVKVRAVCGSDTSAWSTRSFTTLPTCLVPTDLTLSNIRSKSVTIGWTEHNGANEWDLRLWYYHAGVSESFIIPVTTNPFTIKNLVPNSHYALQVRTHCDGNDDSPWSSERPEFYTTDNATETLVEIGSGNNLYNSLPTNINDKYSLSQQIYTAAEIDRSGRIYNVAFYSPDATETRDLDIYMVHTSKTNFTDSQDWVTVNDTDLLFSGEVTFVANDWTRIDFPVPFYYNGTDNLVLIMDDNSGNQSSARNFLGFNAPGQAISIFNNQTDYNPFNPNAYIGNTLDYKNQILLGFIPAVCLQPASLAVSNIGPNTVDLSWTENGDATAWQICVNGDETNLIDVDSTNYNLRSLMPETDYTVKVRANCGGDKGMGPWSESLSFTTLSIEPLVEIGSSVNSHHALPIHARYNFTLSRQIYTAEEIGQAGNIYHVAFINTSQTCTRNLDIYMMHTNKSSFTSDLDWDPVTSADLVFSGNVEFLSNEWTTIELQTPFAYNGNDNLMLVVDDNTGNYTYFTYFSTFDAPLYQTITRYSYDINLDPLNTSGYGSQTIREWTKTKNHIQLGFQPISCPIPGSFTVTNIGSTSATLNWTAAGTATSWQICMNGDESNLIEVSSTSYTLTGLTPETNYTVKVRANCGSIDGMSAWSLEKSFTTYSCVASNIHAVGMGGGRAMVSWEGHADSYILRYKPESGSSWTTLTNITGLTYTITGLPVGNSIVEVAPDCDPTNFISATFSVVEVLSTANWYGYASYTPNGANWSYQFISFSMQDPATVTAATATSDGSYYAAAYANGYVWAIDANNNNLNRALLDNSNRTISNFETVVSEIDSETVASMSYNPVDNRMYYITGTSLKSFHPESPENISEIGALGHTLQTLAINNSGAAYGVERSTGDLYQVNLTDATLTFVGNTGLNCNYVQSMAFDLTTGELFWAQIYSSSDIGLYKVDPTTANTCFLGQIGSHGAELTGLFMGDDNQPSCIAPVNTTVSEVGPYSANISWVGPTGSNEWEYQYSTSADFSTNTVSDFVNNPHVQLTGLTPETTYYVRVRTFCGTMGASYWTGTKSFTTTVPCPAPYDLTSSDITGNSVNIGWTGFGEEYTLEYRKRNVQFSDDFENGLDQWTLIDADGDGHNWHTLATTGGSNVAVSESYVSGEGALTPDNWLVSPQMELGDMVSFWATGVSSWPDEHFAVYVSTTGTDLADFSQVSEEFVATGSYKKYTIDLSAYAGQQGYVAIRHFNVTDMYYLVVYNFTVLASEPWQTVTTDNSSMVLRGLSPETYYEARLQSYCGSDGTSDWSASLFFTTLDGSSSPLVQIGNGESADNLLPTRTYYNYSLSQQIYTPTEITRAGDIYSLAFYMTSDTITRNLDIYMLHSNKTDFTSDSDWVSVTSADLVFSGNVEFLSNDWTTIDLQIPFHYNGTDNLVLVVDDNTGSWVNDRYFRIFDASNQAIYIYNDGTSFDPSNPIVYKGSLTTVKNQIQLGFTPIACAKPTSLTVSEVGPFSANINWDCPAGSNEWEYQYSTSADFSTDTISEIVNTLYAQISGLAPETTYYVRVRTSCDTMGVSRWSETKSFTTPEACPTPHDLTTSNIAPHSAAIGWTCSGESYNVQYKRKGNILFSDDFENGLGQWTLIDADGDGHNWFDDTISGSHAAVSESYSQGVGALTPDNWFVSPQLTLGGMVSFGAMGYSSWPNEHFAVFVSTTGTDPDDFTQVSNEFVTTDSYTEYTADLSAYAGLQGYIAIRHFNVTDMYYLVVDNFTVYAPEPWQTVSTANSSVVLSDLTPETTYYVRVRNSCGNLGLSHWSDMKSFTTMEACPAPYDLTLSDITAHNATIGWTGYGENNSVQYRKSNILFADDFKNGIDQWTLIDADGDGHNWYGRTTQGNSVAASESYRNNVPLTPDNWLISPQVTLDGMVSFWAKGTLSDFPAEHFAVFVSTTGTDPADFTQVSEEFIATDTYIEYTADLSAYAGQQGYVAIRHFNVTDMYYLVVDDFTILSSEEPGPWQTISTDNNSIVLNGLESGTYYEVRVQSDCDIDGESVWSDTLLFPTSDVVIIPTYADIEGETAVCPGNTTELTATSDVEVSYLWSTGETTQTITAGPGDYTVTVTSFTGDELVSDLFTVTEKETYQGDDYKTVCDGELPYIWNGTPYTASDNYTETLTAANGCDSVVTLHLTVNYSTTGIDEQVACDNFTWIDGQTYTESTNTPTITLTNAAGCDSVVTLHLTINHSTFGIDEQVACNSYTWIDGQTYTESTNTPTITLTNAAGCDSVVTLFLTINHPTNQSFSEIAYDTYTWTDGDGLTYNQSGTYYYHHQDANGCQQVDTLFLTVYHSSSNSFFATACESYEWDGRTYTESGDHVWTYKDQHGADSVVTLHLTVYYGVHNSERMTACGKYLWHDTTYTASGTYLYHYTSPLGCPSVDTLHLTVNPTYNTPIEATICQGTSYDFFGRMLQESGEYDHTLYTVNNCDSVITLTLNVTPSYVIDVYDTICEGGSYDFFGQIFTMGGEATYNGQTAEGCDSVVILHLTVIPTTTSDTTAVACDSFVWHGNVFNASGTYHDTLTNAAGCESVVTLNLTINYSTIGDTTAVACESFVWHGVEYTETPTTAPTYIYETVHGCDSVVTLNLTINHSTTGDTTAVECDSFIWHGVEYTETPATAPTYTYQTVNGCDSVVTLNLTINHATTGDTTAVECDSFIWHGVEYTETPAIAPTYTYQTVLGCDSVVTLNLTINHSTIGDTTAVECDSFIWHGVEYTETPTTAPTYTYQTVHGCDSVVTMNLTINHSTTGDTTAVECDSFIWHGVEYTETPATAPTYIYETVHGCDSVVTLNLTINHSTTGDTTAVACDSFIWHGVEYTETPAIAPTYTYETVHGCDSVVTLNLTINHSTTGDTTAVECDSFVWHGVEYTETPATAPTYTYETVHGCDSVVTLNLTINHSTTGDTTAVECDSFVWHGVEYTETPATAPTYTYETVHGCDSVVTLNLTINHSTTGDTTAVACDSFIWHGKVFDATGTYRDTLTNASGCDSVVTLNLTIYPTYNTPISTDICQGGSYDFFGQTLTQTGTYTHTLQTVHGCDSVIILALTVHSIMLTQIADTICEGGSYTFFDQTLTSTGVYAHTLQTVYGCDSLITLALTVLPVPHTDLYAENCNSYEWNGETYTESDDYSVNLTAANGCDSIVTLHLTIHYDVTSEFTIETNEGCYTWNGTEYCQSGDYTQNLETAAGCDSVVTLHLTVGVGIEEHEMTNICLTPNPATNICRIVGLDTDPVSVDIYDMNGKLVRRPNATEFDVSTLPTGIYMVRVFTGERIVNLKMVKQ